MKALGLALTAVLAVSCSSSTAPTMSPGGASMTSSTDEKSGHGDTKVRMYFYAPELPLGGNVDLTGVKVLVWVDPANKEELVTGKRGVINFDVPRGTTLLSYEIVPQAYSVGGWSGCLYRPEGSIPLPYSVRQNWVSVLTGCTPP